MIAANFTTMERRTCWRRRVRTQRRRRLGEEVEQRLVQSSIFFPDTFSLSYNTFYKQSCSGGRKNVFDPLKFILNLVLFPKILNV